MTHYVSQPSTITSSRDGLSELLDAIKEAQNSFSQTPTGEHRKVEQLIQLIDSRIERGALSNQSLSW